MINLAVNARDAMPKGGKLIIETASVNFEEQDSKLTNLVQPGKYIKLSVTDTGQGMSEADQEHIFEPFYTTKELGHGTGLELATVYGIVKQLNGYIWVESKLGEGSIFSVYLPQVENISAEQTEERAAIKKGRHEPETILIVEDEDIVRTWMCRILKKSGYDVIEARNGKEALSICDKRDVKINVVITDVVMPKMGGRELAEKLVERYPEIKILYTSGYTDDIITRHGIMEERMNFIQKPFAANVLLQKVQQLYDEDL
jgi:two-component system cell cycle sensor histidine kinase/response regulator CckA